MHNDSAVTMGILSLEHCPKFHTMARIITFLALFLALTTVRSYAIPNFSINPQCITPAVGDTVTLFVEVDDFTNIASFQYSMNWNPAVMQFLSVDLTGTVNLTDLGGGNFGTTQTAMGNLNVSWNNTAAVGSTLPNDSKIYRLRYKILSTSSPTLTFSGSPTSIEVVNGNGANVIPTFSNLNSPANCGGGSSGFTLFLSDTASTQGDTVCVRFTGQDFDNIVSMQFSIDWNSSVMIYDTIRALNGFPDLSEGNINLINPGTMSFVWFANTDPVNGVTRADGVPLFEICFRLVGTSGSSTAITLDGTPTPVEIGTSTGIIPLQSEPGTVTVTGSTSCPQNQFSIIFADTVVAPNDTICVPVTVNNFDGIASMQFSIHFNANRFYLDTILSANLVDLNISNFGLTDTINGTINFLWFANSNPVNGVTLPDGSTIFYLCFIAEGPLNSSGDINANGTPVPIEVVTGAGIPVVPCFETGTVTITQSSGCSLTAAGTVTNVTCNGGTNGGIDLSVSGSATPTYSWTGTGGFTATTQDISGRPAGTYNVTVTAAGCTNTTATFIITQPSAVTITSVINEVACNGGATGDINISVTGGPVGTNYTYVWSTNPVVTTQDLDNVVAGLYSVTVTTSINSCTAVAANLLITEPGLSLTIGNPVITNVTCNGLCNGAIDINPTGGTGAYEYQWAGVNGQGDPQDRINLCTGTYAVTVLDENNCQTTGSFTVSQPAALTVTGNITNISCGGPNSGAITLTVNGGTGNRTYNWSGTGTGVNQTAQNQTGLSIGSYNVTVTDANQCTTAQSFSVTSAPSLVLTYTQNNVTCNGLCNGSINLTASGGSGSLTYNWTGTSTVNQTAQDQNNLCSGTYSVTVSDANSCTGVLSAILITQPQALDVQANVTNPTNGSNGTIGLVVSGGTLNYTYSWQAAPGIVQGQPNQSGLAPGIYNVTVTDANGCTNSESFELEASVNQIVISNIIVVPAGCPGEANGEIYIDVNGGTGTLLYLWYNITPGPPIWTSQDITGLLPGIYYVVVTDALGQTITSQNVSVPGSSSNLNIGNIVNPQTGSVSLGANGDILISVTGGTLPYTYSWSDLPGSPDPEDRVDILPGFYCVTVGDQSGCNQVLCVTVPYIPSVLIVPSSQVEENDVTCFGENDGSVIMHIQGGDAPYSVFLNDVLIETNYEQTITIDNLSGGNYAYEVQDSNGQSVNVLINIDEPDALDVPFTANNAQCICNGSITLNPTGGTPSSGTYNYVWNDGFTTKDRSGLCPGSVYTCTVSDANGCSFIVGPISITDVSTPLILADIDLNNVICDSDDDGSIILTLSGGVTPYTIIWSDNGGNPIGSGTQITGLSPGNYGVSISDGCPGGNIIQQFTISATTTLAINNVLVTPTSGVGIADGAAQAAVTGGNPDYTYNWCAGTNGPNGTVTGLTAGPCSVTVTDEDGCIVQAEFLVQSGFGPQIAITVNNNVSCYGLCDGSATVNLTGGLGPFTYEWEGGSTLKTANNLCGGVADVTITDSNGTEYVQNVEITQPDPLIVNVIVTDATAANFSDGSAVADVQGGTGPYTYLWNDKLQTITAEVDSLAPGDNYAVLIEDAAGCTELVQNINVGPYILISCFEGSVVITPNEDGKNDVFVVSCNNNYQIHIEIYNRWGQLMFTSDDYQDDWKGLDDKGKPLPEGGYFFVIEADEGNGIKQYKGAISLIREQ